MKTDTEKVPAMEEALMIIYNLVRFTWCARPQHLWGLVRSVTWRLFPHMFFGVMSTAGALLPHHGDKALWADPILWGLTALVGFIWIITFGQAIYWTRRMRRFMASLPREPPD